MTCTYCSHEATDLFDDNDNSVCEDCYHALDEIAEETYSAEAKEYAIKHCKITGEIELYNDEYYKACSTDDYLLGDKDSYTENSVAAHNRHNATNYDDLISGLDKNNRKDKIYYEAIRQRISELIEEATNKSARKHALHLSAQ